MLVSEPMGTLLVNERMLETYLYARDHYLKPGMRIILVCAALHSAGGDNDAPSSSPVPSDTQHVCGSF